MMIAKCSSLTEAGERLFITQQSLGKAMKDLEAELGTKLLLRTNRGCALTQDGQEAVRQGREILDRVNRLQHCFQHDAIPLRGKLIILCSQVMFSDELPLALEAFTKQYPDVEVTAMEKDSYYMPVLQQQLLRQTDAVVISILHMPKENRIGMERIPSYLQFHPIWKAKWMACMNRKNHLAKQMRLTTEQLLKEPIIVSSPDYPEIGLDYMMLCCYGDPNVKRTVSSLELFYNVLGETSDCVGIIPDVLLRSKRAAVPAELVCREIEPHVESTVGYLVDQNQRTQPICRTFLQYLERAVENCDSASKSLAGQT